MPTAPATRLPPRDLALVLAVVAIWGFSFVPIRWALDEVPPLALASLRFALAAVPVVFFVKRPTVPLKWIVAYGLAIGVGQFGLLFIGIAQGVPAGLASLIIQAQVFFTIALAAAFVGDRVLPRQIAGTIVAASGLALLAWTRVASRPLASAAGFALCIAAAFSWALGNVVAKHAAKSASQGAPLDMFSLVVWSSLASPLPLAALSFAFERSSSPLAAIASMSVRAWASVVFMSAVGTLFGFAAWNRLLHRHRTATIAPFALLIPIAGLASAWLFLGERLSWTEGLAGALVLIGLALNVLTWPRFARVAGEASDVEGRASVPASQPPRGGSRD